MFDSDRPIESKEFDLLERNQFACSIAKAIIDYNEKDSLAIGLLGPWGSGKTSILNLIVQFCKENKDQTKSDLIIFEFKPWNYSDQNQLLSQFFKQLANKLKHEDPSKNAKIIGEKLELYADFFKPLYLIPSISPFALLLAKVFKGVGSATRQWGEQNESNLEKTKDELNKLILDKKQKLLVIIDDIDRLNNSEIRQIFQLVKSLADFKNTIYLLSFDKDVVCNALSKVQNGSGEKYLEKVIQVPFDIPFASEQAIQNLLFGQIDSIIKNLPEDKWDKGYWGNIYFGGLRYFFKTIRDINRFINILKLNYHAVTDEVDMIDFISITCLQVFKPSLYHSIKNNKELFTTGTIQYFPKSERYDKNQLVEHTKEFIDKLTNKETEYLQKPLKEILSILFPKLPINNESFTHSYFNDEELHKGCHVSCPEFFDIYFKFALSQNDLSNKLFLSIINSTNNRKQFENNIALLIKENKIDIFLDRLENYTRLDIPFENIETIVSVLMDYGDFFPEGKESRYSLNNKIKLLRIIYQLSQRFIKFDDKYNLFRNAIQNTDQSINTIVDLVAYIESRNEKADSSQFDDPQKKYIISKELLNELTKLSDAKISIWANNGSLKNHAELRNILLRWKRWTKETVVLNYVTSVTETDADFVSFITKFLRKSTTYSNGDRIGKPNFEINREEIDQFLSRDSYEKRVRIIQKSDKYNSLTDQEKLAIKILIDALDGKAPNW